MNKMDVMVVGSGGREDALGRKIVESPHCGILYAVPGNPGMARYGIRLPIVVDDLDAIVAAAEETNVGLVVVGPEAPLAAGLADRLRKAGIPTFGPSAKAARIESSKAYARDLMKGAGVPQPKYRVCKTMFEVEAFCHEEIERTGLCNVVVKFDGLAAGKGAIVCDSLNDAVKVATSMFDGQFGKAGKTTVVVEQRLFGQEASLFVLTDGVSAWPMLPAQDYKPAFDGDLGPNTGGMGSYAPAPILTPRLVAWSMEHIIHPTLRALAADGRPFQGCLYGGFMVVDANPDNPKIPVIEYNCRFGDPEIQSVLPLLDEDLLTILLDVANGRFDRREPLRWKPGCAVTVVLASAGYPGSYESGKIITGIGEAESIDGVTVYHAGTEQTEEGLVTKGGRVVGVTGVEDDFRASTGKAYAGVALVDFDGKQYRKDIAQRCL